MQKATVIRRKKKIQVKALDSSESQYNFRRTRMLQNGYLVQEPKLLQGKMKVNTSLLIREHKNQEVYVTITSVIILAIVATEPNT